MTQREAAEAHQTSERTVRNVLRSYTEGGLEALRSRRTPRQRTGSPAEQALIAALEQEPLAGGDRLWRLAQELMGEAGASLSRRTAYRMLARLRIEDDEEEDDDAPNSLRSLVRSALPLLAEDPPLTLGASELAQQLISEEDEALMRGMLLQQAIRDALDQLRPPGAVSAVDRSWWPYLICTGEYEAGQRRAELQEDLALSASTYSRAKRQGIDTLSALLPQIIGEKIEGPAALASQRLPRTPDFVGRRDEDLTTPGGSRPKGSRISGGCPAAARPRWRPSWRPRAPAMGRTSSGISATPAPTRPCWGSFAAWPKRWPPPATIRSGARYAASPPRNRTSTRCSICCASGCWRDHRLWCSTTSTAPTRTRPRCSSTRWPIW